MKHFKSLSEERAADKYNVNVFGYQTKHYKICPGAKAFMEKLVDGKYGDKNKKEVVRLAKLHDLLFHYEIMALQDANYAKKILSIAKSIAKGIKDQVENNLAFIKINKENFLLDLLSFIHQEKWISIIVEGGAYTIKQFLKKNTISMILKFVCCQQF